MPGVRDCGLPALCRFPVQKHTFRPRSVTFLIFQSPFIRCILGAYLLQIDFATARRSPWRPRRDFFSAP